MLCVHLKFRQDLSLLQYLLSVRLLKSLLCVSAATQEAGVGTKLGCFQVSPTWTRSLQVGQRCVVKYQVPSPLPIYTSIVSHIQISLFNFLNRSISEKKSWRVIFYSGSNQISKYIGQPIICEAWIVKYLAKRMFYKINHSKREKAACLLPVFIKLGHNISTLSITFLQSLFCSVVNHFLLSTSGLCFLLAKNSSKKRYIYSVTVYHDMCPWTFYLQCMFSFKICLCDYH